MQGKDRRIEYFHAECTSYNVNSTNSVEDQLFFTEHFEGLDHVKTSWLEALGLDDSTPMEVKQGFHNTVWSMVNWMESRIQLFEHKPSFNPFTGLDMETGDVRVKQPWIFLDQVADGKVGPISYPFQRKTWRQVVTHLLRKPMFNPSADMQTSGVDEDDQGAWGWLDDDVQE